MFTCAGCARRSRSSPKRWSRSSSSGTSWPTPGWRPTSVMPQERTDAMFFGFRAKIFLAIFGVAGACLLLVATLVSLSLPEQTYQRIERFLVSEAHLVADVMASHERDLPAEEIEREAAHLGKTLPARVTFIASNGAWSATRWWRGRNSPAWKTTARDRKCCRPGRRRRRLAPLQPDGPDGHALRRGARFPSPRRVRAARAAAHRGAGAGRIGQEHHPRRARGGPGGRGRARLARVVSARPAPPVDCRRRPARRVGRFVAARARLRARRTRHGGPGARRHRPRTRRPRRRAGR